MSDLSRRTFLKGLLSASGAASITDLEARILDNNATILLKPTHINNQFFVAENGQLTLGDIWTPDEMKPVTWPLFCRYRCKDKTSNKRIRFRMGYGEH